MRAMMMHFAVGAALANGLDRPVVYRFPSDDACRKNGKTIVEVENTGFDDAVVFAFQGLRVQRLGTVGGMTIRQLVIPPEFLFDEAALRFSVYPGGTRNGSVSDEVSVTSGEKVNLFIPPI
jgi:hypothetical protein